MIPHTCIIKHDPPNSYGDCLRASIAAILSFDHVNDVPHFLHDGCDGNTAHERLKEWCMSVGVYPFVSFYDGSSPLDEILKAMEFMNKHVYYLLFGGNNQGDHVVVCRGEKIVHDTAWYKSPITKPSSNGLWQLMTFVPLAVTNCR